MKSLLTIILLGLSLYAYTQDLILLHTNDIHSHLMGLSPESEYTPFENDNDPTRGGFARLAGYMKAEKQQNNDKLIIVDAGDFLMGSLFQTIELSHGFQLNLMHEMGYNHLALGNHEFDFGPDSLAKIIVNAQNNGPIPTILCTNYKGIKNSTDSDLRALFNNQTILPYDVFEKNGYRIGIFSIMGKNADDAIPGFYDLEFENQLKTARKTARYLKKQAKADIVIALSHSGVYKNERGDWKGEDVEMGRKINDIDIIISGHSHTSLNTPIQAGNTIIVQTGTAGINLGRIEINFDSFGTPLVQYQLIAIDDKITADKEVQEKIETRIPLIETSILKPLGIEFDTPILETAYDLHINGRNPAKSNLGPFVADAMYHWLNKPKGPQTDIVVVAAGVIRNNISHGKYGQQNINDLFNVMPLGAGLDNIPGTPLSKLYVTGNELKKVMELILAVSEVRPNFYLYFSGMRAFINPNKRIFRKVQSLEIGNEQEGYQSIRFDKRDTTLYSVTANAYMVSFIGQLKKMSYGLVNIKSKNEKGEATNPMELVIDLNPDKPGIQEAKEWLSIYHYATDLEDTNGNGIPDIPEKYRKAKNPIIIQQN
ncbi:MAG: bifunctional metallophosphatase/5'-nucleotidase [Prolixibacteraceae bacterium]|nr:bifunctional metallophosphatase/5'-nucleotidase [Prolixibacteraceae bacterium]MBN2650356.1 bifunctional metallophosphatase/5'-nucleotidase [Prolixibacteraceae bacterium]